MFQQLYDEWLAKLSEKAAHVSGSFPDVTITEEAVENLCVITASVSRRRFYAPMVI